MRLAVCSCISVLHRRRMGRRSSSSNRSGCGCGCGLRPGLSGELQEVVPVFLLVLEARERVFAERGVRRLQLELVSSLQWSAEAVVEVCSRGRGVGRNLQELGIFLDGLAGQVAGVGGDDGEGEGLGAAGAVVGDVGALVGELRALDLVGGDALLELEGRLAHHDRHEALLRVVEHRLLDARLADVRVDVLEPRADQRALVLAAGGALEGEDRARVALGPGQHLVGSHLGVALDLHHRRELRALEVLLLAGAVAVLRVAAVADHLRDLADRLLRLGLVRLERLGLLVLLRHRAQEGEPVLRRLHEVHPADFLVLLGEVFVDGAGVAGAFAEEVGAGLAGVRRVVFRLLEGALADDQRLVAHVDDGELGLGLLAEDALLELEGAVGLVGVGGVGVHALDHEVVVVADGLHFVDVALEVLGAVALQLGLRHCFEERRHLELDGLALGLAELAAGGLGVVAVDGRVGVLDDRGPLLAHLDLHAALDADRAIEDDAHVRVDHRGTVDLADDEGDRRDVVLARRHLLELDVHGLRELLVVGLLRLGERDRDDAARVVERAVGDGGGADGGVGGVDCEAGDALALALAVLGALHLHVLEVGEGAPVHELELLLEVRLEVPEGRFAGDHLDGVVVLLVEAAAGEGLLRDALVDGVHAAGHAVVRRLDVGRRGRRRLGRRRRPALLLRLLLGQVLVGVHEDGCAPHDFHRLVAGLVDDQRLEGQRLGHVVFVEGDFEDLADLVAEEAECDVADLEADVGEQDARGLALLALDLDPGRVAARLRDFEHDGLADAFREREGLRLVALLRLELVFAGELPDLVVELDLDLLAELLLLGGDPDLEHLGVPDDAGADARLDALALEDAVVGDVELLGDGDVADHHHLQVALHVALVALRAEDRDFVLAFERVGHVVDFRLHLPPLVPSELRRDVHVVVYEPSPAPHWFVFL